MEYSENKIKPILAKHCEVSRRRSPFSKAIIMVKNVNTGEVFRSVNAAAREYGVDARSIHWALGNSTRKCCGCSWVPYTSDDNLKDEWGEDGWGNY